MVSTSITEKNIVKKRPNRSRQTQRHIEKCLDFIFCNKYSAARKRLIPLESKLGCNDPDVQYIHFLIEWFTGLLRQGHRSSIL